MVEEIVGEIEDEHDMVQREYFKKISKNVFEISARLLIEEFEQKVGNFLTNEEIEKFDTVGGLVFSLAERVPERGDGNKELVVAGGWIVVNIVVSLVKVGRRND